MPKEQVIEENGEEQHVNLLIAENGGKDSMENVLGSVNFSGSIIQLIAEAGPGCVEAAESAVTYRKEWRSSCASVTTKGVSKK